MRDPLTVQVWPWVLIGVAILAGLLYAANAYMARPLTDSDIACGQIDRDLDREREERAAVLVASRLDAIDDVARCEQEQLESEFSAEVLAWLESRETEGAA